MKDIDEIKTSHKNMIFYFNYFQKFKEFVIVVACDEFASKIFYRPRIRFALTQDPKLVRLRSGNSGSPARSTRALGQLEITSGQYFYDPIQLIFKIIIVLWSSQPKKVGQFGQSNRPNFFCHQNKSPTHIFYWDVRVGPLGQA